MDGRGGRHRFVIMILILIITIVVISGEEDHSIGKDGGESRKESEPTLVERAIGFTHFHLASRWDALRTWFKMASINLTPPSHSSESSAGEAVKEAASRSFETSKETVEQAAAEAARVAGEAVEKAKAKLKRTVSTSDPEL